jgi:putative Mg2+ transporter-C (MgtC) family protein
LRTFPSVALASCGFVQARENLLVHSPDGGESHRGPHNRHWLYRRRRHSQARQFRARHATAASLWATGAIGVAVGLGSFDVAVTIAVFTFLTLKLLTLVKDEKEGDGIQPDEK